ncbi:polynucleotide adenylyltransferase PcnB [Frateuria aurantia]|uniref:Poly(A) polymerase I n=1 Tax=Frateuria aurantia (strain ATCC 33424 / DSM 6220 / KCTC 2777 / LMG 1558 / NBRC 3245 / NCIMB 13370) TaxID=767434 RepID=H8L6Y5_FRAAD|nr:polynucleotide adenylyltransferase PcnB [Frateuria aurantia]AFC86895.1 poly(A) polymerase [Frateuria aurantia DSM 6220]
MNDDLGIPTTSSLRVIPREQHPISRRNISKAALRVLYRLNEAGYAAFLVGGAVRDLLLEIQPKDFDVATDATPEEVKALFRNCRVIGRRFRLAHVVFGPEIIEVATFRGTGDEEQGGDRHIVDGRLVRDNVWGSIEEDARRRDFRMNALYYDISDFSVRDYVGGMQDIAEHEVRLIGDPETRYREDPVRMLRAARLAAKLGFQIDPASRQPFASLGDLLEDVAPARLFDESLKLFLAGDGLKSFHQLEGCGLFRYLFPATARVLEGDDPVPRQMIEQGLANTDARIAEGKSVTPAFLFAVLLWAPVQGLAEARIAQGQDVSEAWASAVAQVLAEQTQRVAIPRRFTYTMEEIWLMQPRFEQMQRRRVFALLTHPRFRAGFDFLLLRAAEDEGRARLGQWWGHAQLLPQELLAEALDRHAAANGGRETGGGEADQGEATDMAPAARRKRRPPRRRRARGGAEPR